MHAEHNDGNGHERGKGAFDGDAVGEQPDIKGVVPSSDGNQPLWKKLLPKTQDNDTSRAVPLPPIENTGRLIADAGEESDIYKADKLRKVEEKRTPFEQAHTLAVVVHLNDPDCHIVRESHRRTSPRTDFPATSMSAHNVINDMQGNSYLELGFNQTATNGFPVRFQTVEYTPDGDTFRIKQFPDTDASITIESDETDTSIDLSIMNERDGRVCLENVRRALPDVDLPPIPFDESEETLDGQMTDFTKETLIGVICELADDKSRHTTKLPDTNWNLVTEAQRGEPQHVSLYRVTDAGERHGIPVQREESFFYGKTRFSHKEALIVHPVVERTLDPENPALLALKDELKEQADAPRREDPVLAALGLSYLKQATEGL